MSNETSKTDDDMRRENSLPVQPAPVRNDLPSRASGGREVSARLVVIGVTVDAECNECAWYACGHPFQPEVARLAAEAHNSECHEEREERKNGGVR